MYGSPEARICPRWCWTQKSQALRIRFTSSVGRLACTCRSRASNRRSMASRSAIGRTAEISPFEVGVGVGISVVVGCRTVAMLHYRPELYLGHDWATEPLIYPEDAALNHALCNASNTGIRIPNFSRLTP